MFSVVRILLVEPKDATRGVVESTASSLAQVESHGDFETARTRLRHAFFDFLVANVRLKAYNGLHLVYLSSTVTRPPRSIVYTDEREAGLAREVQRSGAFYEVGTCLPVVLRGYLNGTLPVRDRRDPIGVDRRRVFRNGRRGWDRHLARQTA